jgi:hypothetical protein
MVLLEVGALLMEIGTISTEIGTILMNIGTIPMKIGTIAREVGTRRDARNARAVIAPDLAEPTRFGRTAVDASAIARRQTGGARVLAADPVAKIVQSGRFAPGTIDQALSLLGMIAGLANLPALAVREASFTIRASSHTFPVLDVLPGATFAILEANFTTRAGAHAFAVAHILFGATFAVG